MNSKSLLREFSVSGPSSDPSRVGENDVEHVTGIHVLLCLLCCSGTSASVVAVAASLFDRGLPPSLFWRWRHRLPDSSSVSNLSSRAFNAESKSAVISLPPEEGFVASAVPEDRFEKPSAIPLVYWPRVTALGKMPSERSKPNNFTSSTLLSLPALPKPIIKHRYAASSGTIRCRLLNKRRAPSALKRYRVCCSSESPGCDTCEGIHISQVPKKCEPMSLGSCQRQRLWLWIPR
mmetsp:Transcript_38640/g.116019  ORF Transcript_38640/g.116019 Transcript_38640/m.116019 type:complete len:234 (-) Transcript_38640:3318-4019(-)